MGPDRRTGLIVLGAVREGAEARVLGDFGTTSEGQEVPPVAVCIGRQAGIAIGGAERLTHRAHVARPADGPIGGSNAALARFSARLKATIVSNIGTSTSYPWPCARAKSDRFESGGIPIELKF